MNTLLYPTKLGLIFIAFGVILFVIDEFILDTVMLPFPWVGAAGILIVAAGTITFGFMSIRYYGFAKRRLVIPVFGVLLFIASSWGSFIGLQSIEGLLELFVPNENYAHVINNEEIPTETRVLLSKMYAQQCFVGLGQTIEYYAEGGSKKLYIPTKTDVEIVKKNEQMLLTGKSFLIFAYLCITGLILSLLLVFYIPIRKKAD